MSSSDCCFLICIQVSREAGTVVWYSGLFKNFPLCCSPHKGFSIVSAAEVDVFLEFPCFLHDPTDVGNLISRSSSLLNSACTSGSCEFMLLMPSLKDFEHYFAGMWNKKNCMAVWAFFGIAVLWDWNKNWPLTVLWPLTAAFSKFAGILTAALSQHHLLWFEITQLEFHHLH